MRVVELFAASATTVALCTVACPDAGAQELALPFAPAAENPKLPAGWTARPLRGRKPVRYELVEDSGTLVLRAMSEDAASSLTRPLDLPGMERLSWRWKIDHAVAAGDLRRKTGDDFAARVYVSFDLPESELGVADRLGLRLLRLTYDADIPTAALCYVWDKAAPVGTVASSAYTDHVRLIVLESGNAHAGEWRSEERDLDADYRTAFGRTAPRVTGIALMSDTDDTHGQATAWFADIRFRANPTRLQGETSVSPREASR